MRWMRSWSGSSSTKVNWILDADIRSFFDEVSQDWLVRFLEHRIGDRRIIRLIQKWLKAGILEDGVVTVSERGTGQGSVISPLLANIYLHYVFDLWAERWRRREATGDMIIVRYADDFVVGFEHEADARRFLDAMRERLRGVRAVAASGEDPADRVRPPCGGKTASGAGLANRRPSTSWASSSSAARSRRGKFQIKRKSRRDRMRAKLQGHQTGTATADAPANPRTGKWLKQVVTGYFNYHAVPTNGRALAAFRFHVTDSLATHAAAAQPEGSRRRGSGSRGWPTTGSHNRVSFIPGQMQRFAVRHPRWEPYARIPGPLRICAGGAQ